MCLSSSWEALWGLTGLNPPPPPNSPDWVINRSPAGKRGASRRWDTEEALIWEDSGLANETLKISELITWELESCSQKLLPTDHVFLGVCYTFFLLLQVSPRKFEVEICRHKFFQESLCQIHTELMLGWLLLCVLWLSCRYSEVDLQWFPWCLTTQTRYVHFCWNGVRELCFLKNNAIHEHSRRRKSGPLWEQAAASRGIVTRCKGGNTWSIPSCRNVFISLFTNVAISRCVHFKVHCSTGSPSSGVRLQWGTCAGARASLFEQLAQFSPACTYVRRSESVVPHRVRKNTGLQRDRLYLIQCHRIKRLEPACRRFHTQHGHQMKSLRQSQ